MGFRFFVGIAVAVAVGVAIGLSLYNNPDKTLETLRTIVKFIFWTIPKNIFLVVTRPIRIIFRGFMKLIEKREEWSKEKEYKAALLKDIKTHQISKEEYFLNKEKEQEAEKKALRKKYGSDVSIEEAQRLEKIKKQKEEYDAMPPRLKAKKAKERKKDTIIIIICLAIVLLPSIIIGILNLLGIE